MSASVLPLSSITFVLSMICKSWGALLHSKEYVRHKLASSPIEAEVTLPNRYKC